jgi:hypothetical protein
MALMFDFAQGAQGWSAGFTDYALTHADPHLTAALRPLPAELGMTGTGFYLQGTNVSDDLFMFLTRPLTPREGIAPHGRYRVSCEITCASNAPTGAVGVGGAPGEAVFMKGGAAPVQPTPLIDHGGHVTINIDKGHQGTGGAHMGVVGNIANGRPPTEPPQYVLLTQTYCHPVPIAADADGTLWLIVGTDSGFEGHTALYYTKLSFHITS